MLQRKMGVNFHVFETSAISKYENGTLVDE